MGNGQRANGQRPIGGAMSRRISTATELPNPYATNWQLAVGQLAVGRS
jgi:hypothetical protein